MPLVICKFEPGYRHLAGADKKNWHFGRGAWIVTACFLCLENLPPVFHRFGSLGVRSVHSRGVGTRVSPIKLLREYLASRYA